MVKLHNRDIEWWLFCGARALGLKSSLAGQIFCLESGGPSQGFRSPEWGGDVKEVERARKCSEVWNTLTHRSQTLLMADYVGQLPSEMTNKSNEAERFARFPPGVAGFFDVPGLACLLAHEAGELQLLVQACKGATESSATELKAKYQAASLKAQREAHEEWSQAYRAKSARAKQVRERFSGRTQN